MTAIKRMRNGLTNLVPSERQRASSHNYILRLGVVSAVLASALVAAAGVLLIPTYVYLAITTDAKIARLAIIEKTLTSGDEKQLSERLAALGNDADILLTLQNMPSASTIVRSLLDISHPGITLAGISYTPADGTKQSTLAVIGAAATRDALRTYQLALASASFSRGANLPVSAYAKDSNIPFTVTVTLAP